jgi:pimeloyl-ACP methyl ester carboxylesterase
VNQQTLRDIIVVLPGIGGSYLSHNGKPIWAPTVGAAYRAASGAKALTLDDERGDPDKLAGGVIATGLVNDIHILPGLWKIDGYSRLIAAIEKTFQTSKAFPESKKLANLIIFPYDWRRDNRITARRLQNVVNDFLARWHKETFFKDAKVILIAHSMGGLISRHYLDVLGGWSECRALFTFGTPFRGSLNALDTLVNGVRKLGGLIDLSSAFRSMPSVYQLLPRYECVLQDKAYRRVVDATRLCNLEAARARVKDALSFYEEIDQKVGERNGNLNYEILPYAGIHQSTSQSAEVTSQGVGVVAINPSKVPEAYEDGDGTVPLVSAIPLELSTNAQLVTSVNEKHASLQANTFVLDDLMRRLLAMEVQGLQDILGGVARGVGLALALDLDDAFEKGVSIPIRVRVKNAPADTAVRLRLENAETRKTEPVDVKRIDGIWTAELKDLDPGSYRIEAIAHSAEGDASVRDVFAVAGE